MIPFLKKMGCGRSKQHTPKLGDEEKNGPKEKSSSKKKKEKAKKKENKDPLPDTEPGQTVPDHQQQHHHHHLPHLHIKSPVKTIANALKPPPPPANMNGSPRQASHLLIDDDCPSPPIHPTHHEKGMDHLGIPGKEMKEFRGKSNFKITHSAVAFFEMLDAKIEQGDDYASEHSGGLKTPEEEEG